jgi:hypothetical protein
MQSEAHCCCWLRVSRTKLLFVSVQRCLLSKEGDAAGATATRLAGVDDGVATATGTGAKEEDDPAPIERLK